MGKIKAWLQRFLKPRQPVKKNPRKHQKTAVSGGMGSTEMLIRLEIVLGDIQSTKPLAKYAYELAGLSHNLQTRLLSDLSDISGLSYQHGCEVLSVAAEAVTGMEQPQYEKWIDEIKSLLNDGYFEAASKLINNYTGYVEAPFNVNLNDITETLEKLVFSICEKEITILAAPSATNITAYTNGQQFFLPVKISYFDQQEDNFRLYKILTFQLLQQLRTGTWAVADALVAAVEQQGGPYLAYFSLIETLRINCTIKKSFPGVWRDIEKIHQLTDTPYPDALLENVNLDTVDDSLELSRQFLQKSEQLPSLIYQPVFIPEKILETASSGQNLVTPNKEDAENSEKLQSSASGKMSQEIQSVVTAVEENFQQDTVEEVVSDAVDADFQAETELRKTTLEDVEEKQKTPGIFYYKEWDSSLQKYKKDWCHVKEKMVEDSSDDPPIPDPSLRFAEFRIKKTLDMLVNDQRFMRFQNEGDDIDIDAWVSARSDRNKHADDFQNVYIRNNKNTRNVAIMFAMDVSGSTRGWKNTAIKQSTGLLCKTLARLDDQYAVYGFSGSGRKNCHIYPIKGFGEPYGRQIHSRICAMQPQQYTRLGAAIRHLGAVLGKTSAKTRILFVLTDGKPDDIDSYRGQYAIEDTRRALNEAKALSLNPFVLTFDKEGMDYLPHMLGVNRYQLIAEVSQLPQQISTIYKHLTT